jgi:hypothetical protein
LIGSAERDLTALAEGGVIHIGVQTQVQYIDEKVSDTLSCWRRLSALRIQTKQVLAVCERPEKQSLVADFFVKSGLIYAAYSNECAC